MSGAALGRGRVPAPHLAVERFELACGAVLLVDHRPEAPVTAIKVHVRGGHSLDRAGLEGTAYRPGRLLDQGTESRTEEELALLLAPQAGSLRGDALGHSGTISGSAWKLLVEVVCDTVVHSTPWGVRSLIRFVKDLVDELGADVGIDWHGHRERGLGLVNALEAVRAGVTRVHATALGVGERAGNTEMDLLLVNLRLAGMIDNDLSALSEYCELASRAIGVPLPPNYPVFGKDAFETATGVHAAAVIKAFKKGDHWLANRVYSGVPADLVGLEQVIAVGPMSGKSNVTWFLEKHGVQPTDERVQRVLELAKKTPRLLTEQEILAAAS